MDIKPPPKKLTPRFISEPQPKNAPIITPRPLPPKNQSNGRRWNWKWIAAVGGAVLIIAVTAFISWYAWALQPLDAYSTDKIRITVATGDSSSAIARTLKEHGVVRSATAFRLHAEINGAKNNLKAGGYIVSPAQSISDIINHLVSGQTDELTVTIPPGVTLKGIREKLLEYGYSDSEITGALDATYDSPLLDDKPAGASLEGYIFPETFKVDPNDRLQALFKRSFDELYARLQSDGMIDKFKSRGLNLHQAMTLASIVQKEVSNPVDQRQVAQVFYKRLGMDVTLGSDVTFIYAANQLGIEPSINLDSPYNTRKYTGLPPGPIANMNYTAIQAIADPAPGDYLYFVAGDRDDAGKTFYSRTEEEHLQNVADHCHELCN